jgi:hypothetical protein
MSQDNCPECGSQMNWLFGVGECPNCEYTEVLSPCTCCTYPLLCPTKEKCKDYQHWVKTK